MGSEWRVKRAQTRKRGPPSALAVFSSKTKKMFPGDKMPKMPYLEKMANGSHFRGTMSNVMAKKSTETNFKYKKGNEWNLFSKTLKMFPADKMQKVALSREKWHYALTFGAQFQIFLQSKHQIPFSSKNKRIRWNFSQKCQKCFLGTKARN